MIEPEPKESMDELVSRARRVLQQHVAFGGVPVVHHEHGTYPHYAACSAGCRFWDVSGREYLDWFVGGGPVTLGHGHPEVQRAVVEQLGRGAHLSIPTPLEIEVAELICELVPSAEQVAFGKNGSDVTGAAAKLARAITGRDAVMLCGYHGFQDWSMAAKPNPRGIPAVLRGLALEYAYNDLESAAAQLRAHGDRVAAIFVEPLQHEDVQPDFLAGLRELADRYGSVLVFDEIVTGFRVARGGMQERSGVLPDLTCIAKAVANGFPLAALVGRRRFMKHLQQVRFGMTYRRDALSLAAAKATLEVHRREDVAGHLERIGERLRGGFRDAASSHGLDWSLDGLPHLLHLRIGGGGRLRPLGARSLFIEAVQRAGVFITPGRIWSSFAHGDPEVDRTIAVLADAIATVRRAMDVGLERVLDGPIHAEAQTPEVAPAPAGPAWRSETLPIPFGTVDDAVRRLGVRLTGSPDRAVADGHVRDDRIELGVATASHAIPATCAVVLGATLDGDLRVAARYRFVSWDPQNATVELILAANAEPGGEHHSVRHESCLAALCWTRATGPGGQVAVPCAAGVNEGVLQLERLDGRWQAHHETGDEIERLPIRGGTSEGPLRIVFRLRVRGRSGAVVVELLDLRCDARPRDGAAAAREPGA